MVRTGLDLWIGDSDPGLRTLRLGLVAHPAAVLPDLAGAVDALQRAGYKLTALFGLPGVRLRPTFFTPFVSIHACSECQGVQVHVTDREALRPVSLGLHLIAAVRALHPHHFEWNSHFDRLTGSSRAREALEAGCAPDVLIAKWAEAQITFAQTRADYLLYN